MRRIYLLLIAFSYSLILFPTFPVEAVLLDSEDGSANTRAPGDDPGWSHVGIRSGLTAIYLGDRWVLTARHVGPGHLRLGGRAWPSVPGSMVRLHNPGMGDKKRPDLILFRLTEQPTLPSLSLATRTPATGTEVLMIGHGLDRGPARTVPGSIGWQWGDQKTLRWGTNRVHRYVEALEVGNTVTHTFTTRFSLGDATQHEAQAVVGDSGGAVFVRSNDRWELAGVMLAATKTRNGATIYGDETYIADLARYRSQILEIMEGADAGGSNQGEDPLPRERGRAVVLPRRP